MHIMYIRRAASSTTIGPPGNEPTAAASPTSVGICLCIYTCMHIYIYIYIHMCIYICLHVYIT